MTRLFTALSFLAIVVVSFIGTGVAYAADPESILELAKPVFDAVLAGQYLLAAALMLVLAVAVIRRYVPWPFLRTDDGGALLALVASFGGAMATAIAAGAPLSWGMAWVAVGVAFAAAGGYSMIKKLLVPRLQQVRAILPPWARPILSIVLWIFERPDQRVADAEKAGDAAVNANPGQGAKSVLGEPTELK